ELAEADSIPQNYLNWFVVATGYWPLFYNEVPNPKLWGGMGVIQHDPNSMRKNLYGQGFDTTRSDFYHYKAFLDTLYPVDYSIIPDTIKLDFEGEVKNLFALHNDPPEIIRDWWIYHYEFGFDKTGRLISFSQDGNGFEHRKWDSHGNIVYFDYYNGPAGDNLTIEREYDGFNNLKREKYFHSVYNTSSWLREFDENQRVTLEIIENDSLKYSKTYDYDENGNTKRINVAFMKGNEEAKSDTLFTKTTFFDLTMSKMNPDSGFGVDSVKTTGDESVIEKYKRFIGHWPDW
ncbi:MAG: hypothetical protein ACP5G4_09755, partial [bacterium]